MLPKKGHTPPRLLGGGARGGWGASGGRDGPKAVLREGSGRMWTEGEA